MRALASAFQLQFRAAVVAAAVAAKRFFRCSWLLLLVAEDAVEAIVSVRLADLSDGTGESDE